MCISYRTAYIPCIKHFLYAFVQSIAHNRVQNRDLCVWFVKSVVEIVMYRSVFVGACSVGFFSDLYYQGTRLDCFGCN